MAPQGWNTGEQIRSHKLVTSIINGHGTERDDVLDDSELDLLRRFTKDPSVSTRDQILEEKSWNADGEQDATSKAHGGGSLAGYLIAKHGTDDPALDERDLTMLKEWFERGTPTGQSVAR